MLSWECPGHVLDIAKCPQLMWIACPIWTFEYKFDETMVHVAPHTSTIIQTNLEFFTFSAFSKSSDLHKPVVCIKKI